MIQSVFDNFIQYYNLTIGPTSRVYPLYLISALILAILAYIQVERAHAAEDAANDGHDHGAADRPGFLQYVFDPRIIF
ncbi:MAG: hypothetical protein ACR2O4_09140, partial [Hyphomicrobiaceae bacterium]